MPTTELKGIGFCCTNIPLSTCNWRDFPHPFRPAVKPTQPPIIWVSGLFPGVMRPGRGVDHPPHLATRLKKE